MRPETGRIPTEPAGIQRKLLLVLALYALLAGTYTVLTPPFEASDEPQHLAYVSWLAEGKGLPPQGEAAWETPIRQEASQPPLYYWLSSIPARIVGTESPPALFRPNPHFPSSAPGTVPDNKNVAIHYPADTHPLQGGWLALYLARAVTLLFGLVLVVSACGLARQVVPRQPQVAMITAMLIAFSPQVLFESGVVSNDIPAAATATLTLWLLARLLRQGPSLWRAMTVGLAFGLAALCKTNSLGLALPLAGGLGWLFFSRPSRQAMAVAGWGALTAFVTAGWWYIRTWALYGTPLGLDTHYLSRWALGEGARPAGLLAKWREVFYSYWAAFGWGNIKFAGWVYLPLLALVLAAAVGLLVTAGRRLLNGRRITTAPVLVGLLALTLLALALALEYWTRQVRAPHGRLLFPGLGAAAVLMAIGWRAVHRWLPRLGVGYLAVLAMLSPIVLIGPAYAPPRPAAPPVTHVLGWRFGEVAILQSATPLAHSVAAGETLQVEVCWVPLARADRDYSVLLHLVGPENQVVARRHTYPGLGSYPTSAWIPNRGFCDRIPVDIPDDLPQTLAYQVEVGLLDIATLDRLPVRGTDGRSLSQTFVGRVRLSTAEPGPAAAPPAGDGPIRLADWALSSEWRAGDDQELRLVWWMAEEVDQDYTVFIHLLRPSSQEVITQADGPPLDGWYPTSWWTAGETVTDVHRLGLSSETPLARYELVVGWYQPASGERLGAEQRLGVVEVVP